MRFSRIMDVVEGVSQKSLTKTLRGLERDGLITRRVFAEVPPRVEYAITSLGPHEHAGFHHRRIRTELNVAERGFIGSERPWGFILFNRNKETPAEVI